MTKKRKRTVWDKVTLMETSVVGIPAYPDAHLSYENKTLTTGNLFGNNQLNDNPEEPMAEEEPKVETPETPETPEAEEATTEEEEEKSEPETEEAEPETEETTEDPEPEKPETDVKSIVKDAISSALKEYNEERALIDKKEVEKATMRKKSIGEMAIDAGLF